MAVLKILHPGRLPSSPTPLSKCTLEQSYPKFFICRSLVWFLFSGRPPALLDDDLFFWAPHVRILEGYTYKYTELSNQSRRALPNTSCGSQGSADHSLSERGRIVMSWKRNPYTKPCSFYMIYSFSLFSIYLSLTFLVCFNKISASSSMI